MTNYICINGKKAELTKEQMKALGIELPKKSPFTMKRDERHWFITSYGTLAETDSNANRESRHNVANYCTDHDMMEQRALHETLNRLLWRYSMEHKGEILKSESGADVHYRIGYWTHDSFTKRNGFYADAVCRGFGLEPYFDTKEIAKSAIEEIIKPFMKANPDFKW